MQDVPKSLPPFTDLAYRMEFLTHTLDWGTQKTHYVRILVPPENGGYLPDVISGHYFGSRFIYDYSQNIPYAFHQNGKIFFGDIEQEKEDVPEYKLSQKITRELYQEGIMCYANYRAAEYSESVSKEDFLLIESEYLTEGNWESFISSNKHRRSRKIIGRYHSKDGAIYSLTQRVYHLESLSGRASLAPKTQRTEWQVKYPYILCEYSEVRACLMTIGLREYLREGKFTDFKDFNIAKIIQICPSWMRIDASIEIAEAEQEILEKAHYEGGDGRIMRDSSNGQFGSYPSFEGDDDSE
ncbi:hypothetical protein WDJ50_13930 [Deinococcus sp. VB142]|uniref:Uncharacterized protein n=1 Tax=Deinococcus sp. VB142 TaxID=3112952 RepID=A0AAU6Q1K8_9DEIO